MKAKAERNAAEVFGDEFDQTAILLRVELEVENGFAPVCRLLIQ